MDFQIQKKSGLNHLEYGFSTLEFGIWNMEYGFGIWNMEYGFGIWNMVFPHWNLEMLYGMLLFLLPSGGPADGPVMGRMGLHSDCSH